jgi:hypothetical protein
LGSERTVFPVLLDVSAESLPPLLRRTQALSIEVDDPAATRTALARLTDDIAQTVRRIGQTPA